MGTTPDDAVLAYLAQHRSHFLAALGDRLRTPSVSADPDPDQPRSQDVLGVPVLFLGISVPSDGWHSVDETVDPGPLLTGVRTAAHLWEEPAADRRAEPWPATAA